MVLVWPVILVEPQSWHHGPVARWWSLFRDSGPEMAYFRQFVEAGPPALDIACGAGRLHVHYVEAGLDVDDCDVSPHMVALCAHAAGAVDASPNLDCQAMHELYLSRQYRTIFVCGGLGLGSTPEQDQEALRRLDEHLEPGGRLVLDNAPVLRRQALGPAALRPPGRLAGAAAASWCPPVRG